MHIESLREYCLSKKGVTESFPFDEDTLMGKMFCLTSLKENDRMNLKCEPEKAIRLREKYSCVLPGWHMNKNMWNTVVMDGSVSDEELRSWIDHSYDEVVKKLPKKIQKELSELL
jgi:predicted DNA-binding protein (MmcQ/YjbR family)